MGIKFTSIDDAVIATQEAFVKKGAFLDLQTDLTDHVAVREMWKGRKNVFDGGHPWEFEAQVDHNHSARAVDLYETDGTALTDTLRQGTVDARHVNAAYIYDQREKAFQRGGKAIVNLIQSKYVAMMVSFYEYLEATLWGFAASTDTKTPFGIQNWVVKNTSEGFNAENPSGYTAGRANIDSTASGNARWSNYAGDYAEITKEDLIRMMRRAHRKTRFRSPMSHAQPTVGGMKNGIYTNDTVIGIFEEKLEEQNMNLGNDLASKDGKTMFKSTPVTYAPYLDNDTENPVYMLDWKWLAIGVLAGWENELTKPYMVPGKHLVRRVDLDATLNMICTNLRRQSVFHNPA